MRLNSICQTTLFLVIITGLLVSARMAEAGPVSFLGSSSREIFCQTHYLADMEDLDARDSLNRPIRDARVIWNLREVFVLSIYRALLTRMPLSAEVVEKSAASPQMGFSSVKQRFPFGSGNAPRVPAAIFFQFFERLKKYLYSFIALTVAALFVWALSHLFLASGFAIFDISQRQPPVLKPVFTVLRC